MKVFVLNMRGKPLMPCSPAKARHMLKAGKAVVVRRASNAVHDQADHRHRRDEAGRDAWRRCRRKARWHFRHDGKGGDLRVRGQASTGHHGTSGRSSGIPTCKAQSKDALPRSALQQSRSIKAQGMACAVRGEPYPSAHFAHRGGLQTASRHQDRD